MKNIVIAGGSGKLGEYLIKNLKQKNEVISLSRSISKNTKNNYLCNFLNEKKLSKQLKDIKFKFKKLDCIIFTIGNSKKNSYQKDNFFNKMNDNFISFKNLLDLYCKIFKFHKIKIIVISSIVTEKILLDAPIEYSVSKSALKQFALIKAKDLASKNININIISPGNILLEGNNWSKRLKINKELTIKYIKQNVPIKKFIDAKMILETCELIMNDNNNFYTGNNFILDGGQSL